MPHRLCEACGKRFQPLAQQKRRRFCCLRCAYNVRFKPHKPCPVCGKPFRARHRITCSAACGNIRKRKPKFAKVCPRCNQSFEARDKRRTFCSNECFRHRTLMDVFLARILITDTCWLWTGSLDKDGYGLLHFRGKSGLRAHRVAYRLFVGRLTRRHEIDHTCRVHECVRPKHLEKVTHEENQRRGRSLYGKKIRQREQTECMRGHPFDEKNTYVNPSNGQRSCRICNCARVKTWYRQHHHPRQ